METTALNTPKSDYDEIREEIDALGLRPYVDELDELGYTIIPPEMVLAPGGREELLEAVLNWAENCHGVRPDLTADESSDFEKSDFGDYMPTVLGAGPLFERTLLNPVVLALATWLTGYSTNVDFYGPAIKGAGGPELDLHTDAQLIQQVPGPLPDYSLTATMHLTLTDFTRENGCTAIVPRSHKRCAWGAGPLSTEPTTIPAECPAGSLIVWHGNTWHGAYPRTASGKRVSLVLYFNRHWLRPREDWMEHVTPEVLARNPPRLADLLGCDLPFGYHTYEQYMIKVVRNARPRSAIGKELSAWT